MTEDDVKALKTAIMTGTDAPAWLDGMLRQNAVRSWNVMAITFTNKAAGELKERLRNMLGDEEGTRCLPPPSTRPVCASCAAGQNPSAIPAALPSMIPMIPSV